MKDCYCNDSAWTAAAAVDIVEAWEPDELFKGSEDFPRFAEIRSHCEWFDSTKFIAAALQEEQERELSPEIEAERQVEKPRPAKPMRHIIYKDVRT